MSQNQPIFNYSLKTVDAAIDFIQNSGFAQSYTLEMINGPVPDSDLSAFSMPAAMSKNVTV